MKGLPILAAAGPADVRRADAFEPAAPVVGPKEAALRALWPIAVARLRAPRGWWTWARLARRYRLRTLRPSQLVVRVADGLLPDCASCTEVCCTGPNAIVSLRLIDVARLVDAGLERYVVRGAPTAAGDDATWARREADGSVFRRAFPILARDRTGTCALLTEDRLCGAHPAWPLSCARYPYALDLLGRSVFYAKGCGSRELLPYADAAPRVRRLVEAVVEGYNERVKDVVLVHVARRDLADLDLARHVSFDEIDR